MPHLWKVVPLSPGQKLDVSPDHIVDDGCFRLCDTYKGGGGYDNFPSLAKSRFGEGNYDLQFVVQLHRCPLDCPWCYVTREGVWGSYRPFSSTEMVAAFNQTRAKVFHLMGGAPGMYLEHWPELLDELERRGKQDWVFTSDLMLVEKDYDGDLLRPIDRPRVLCAVSIKGVTSTTFENNTRKGFPEPRFWRNLKILEREMFPYYITFTNVPGRERTAFWNRFSYEFGEHMASRKKAKELVIDLVQYKALPHVDDVPWGGRDVLG